MTTTTILIPISPTDCYRYFVPQGHYIECAVGTVWWVLPAPLEIRRRNPPVRSIDNTVRKVTVGERKLMYATLVCGGPGISLRAQWLILK